MINLFDGHCDTISVCYEQGGGLRTRSGHLDLQRTRQFGRYAQFFALFGDRDDCGNTPLFHLFHAQYALFIREMERNADMISFCRTGEEAQRAFEAGKSAAFLSVEGADMLDCDLVRLEEAYRMGVRAVNLTWNHASVLSGTNAEEPERGLSPLGRAFVQKMQALGMLVDVSHLSDPGFWDVIDVAEKPIVATHSNARALCAHTRNLTDAQFTAIIANGGVVGLNMYAEFLGENPDLDTVAAHLEHFLSLGGADNVAIGGDWDGFSILPGGISGIWDLEKLYERLLRHNYSETLVQNVFFANLMRVVSKVCSM